MTLKVARTVRRLSAPLRADSKYRDLPAILTHVSETIITPASLYLRLGLDHPDQDDSSHLSLKSVLIVRKVITTEYFMSIHYFF